MLVFAAAILGIDPTPHIRPGTFIHQMLAMVILMVGGAVKIATPAASSDVGTPVVGLSVMPLLASVAGFGTMALILTRRLKRSPTSVGSYIEQAFRLLVVVVLLLVAISVGARGGHSAHAADYVRVKGPYSVFFGACVTLLTLVLTFFFSFGETLSGRASRWHQRLFGPALGIVTIISISFAGGTAYALIQILADPHHVSSITQLGLFIDNTSGRKDQLDSLLAFSLNHAMWLLSWGMGIPLRIAFGGHQERVGLTHFTDKSAVYWLLPLATSVAWLKAASVTFLYGSSPAEGRRNGFRLPLLAPVLTTAIFVLAGFAEQLGGFGHAIRLHFYFWWALLSGLLWATAAGVIAPALVMAMPRDLVRRAREVLVRRFGAPTLPADKADGHMLR